MNIKPDLDQDTPAKAYIRVKRRLLQMEDYKSVQIIDAMRHRVYDKPRSKESTWYKNTIARNLKKYHEVIRPHLFDCPPEGIRIRVVKRLKENMDDYKIYKKIVTNKYIQDKVKLKSWRLKKKAEGYFKSKLDEIPCNSIRARIIKAAKETLSIKDAEDVCDIVSLQRYRTSQLNPDYVKKEALKTIRACRKELKNINRNINLIYKHIENEKISHLTKEEKTRLRWQVQSHKRNSIFKKDECIKPYEWYGLMKQFGYKCAYCGIERKEARKQGHDLELDHLLPITCGVIDNTLNNMVPACKPCNSSKSNNELMEWLELKGHTPSPLALQKYNAMVSKYHMLISFTF